MALSFGTSRLALGNRAAANRLIDGLQVRTVEMTVGDTADYSSGFDLAANLSSLGVRSVVAVLNASIRQSGGTHRTGLLHNYNATTGKLQFVLQGAGAGPLTEITPASHLAANDVVRMVVLGT